MTSHELPPPLQAAIDGLVRAADRPRLEAAAVRLSAAYREGGAARPARTREDVLAYAAQRAPATYAAAVAALMRAREQRPEWRPRSLLDVGAGPGTASWAALAVWPELKRIVLVEAEPEMVALGRALGLAGGSSGAEWIGADWLEAGGAAATGSFEVVLAGYVLNELPRGRMERAVRSLWERTADTLVVLEPGTPGGYERVLAARAAVVAGGGFTLAPCPHDASCPLVPPDWCHFGARLQRGESHRLVKDVSRGFEDEKFAYAVLTRSVHRRAGARVIRPPQARTGHVLLDLCEPSGVRRTTISKRDRDAYRRARKAGWGDAFDTIARDSRACDGEAAEAP